MRISVQANTFRARELVALANEDWSWPLELVEEERGAIVCGLFLSLCVSCFLSKLILAQLQSLQMHASATLESPGRPPE